MDILKKKLVTEMYQGWYLLDNILFGGIPDRYITEDSDYNNYLKLKNVFLSTLFEYYNHIKYKSGYDSLPKNEKQLIKESCDLYFRLKDECLSEMKENKEKISKVVTEGLTIKEGYKINNRLSVIKLNSLFNKCFLENANNYCGKRSRTNDVKGILLNNCLTEAKREFIKLSKKYYPYF